MVCIVAGDEVGGGGVVGLEFVRDKKAYGG